MVSTGKDHKVLYFPLAESQGNGGWTIRKRLEETYYNFQHILFTGLLFLCSWMLQIFLLRLSNN